MNKYMNLNEWKLLYIFGLFLATFIFYLAPILIIRKQQLKSWTLLVANQSINTPKTYKLLSACNCLSAGIFMGICFLGLIPYVEEEFSEILKASKIDTKLPVGLFIVIMGVFLVLSLETIIKELLNKTSPPVLNLEDDNSKKKIDEKHDKQELIEVCNDDKETEKFIMDKDTSLPRACHHCLSHSPGFDINSIDSYLSFSLLIFAKSVHSIFEGLALGLLNDSHIAWNLFVAVLLHECLIAFALGLSSQRIEFQMKTNFKFAVVFSITIPIGIALGIIMSYTPGLLGRSITGVLQAFAAGTFIHVTFNELIPFEFMSSESDSNGRQKLFKIFLLFIGFCFIALITALTQEFH